MEYNYGRERRLQQAWVEFAGAFEPNFYVTLTDPTDPHLTTMGEKLGKLCGRIDRAVLKGATPPILALEAKAVPGAND